MSKGRPNWRVRARNTDMPLSDNLVASAVKGSSFGDVTYSTTEEDLTGFIQPGSAGINHGAVIL